MKTHDQFQTMAVAYAEICQGEEPWIALGSFTIAQPEQVTHFLSLA
jgi:hypothetical protein